jgi:DNA-binding GntR family transcriptional regulator
LTKVRRLGITTWASQINLARGEAGVANSASGKAIDMELKGLLDHVRTRHRTAASAVTEALRTAIIDGVFPEGAALRQDLLAAELGVSRMPIRESLRRLEAEGLVDFVPHCGAVVATLSTDDILEIAQMRVALESLALALSFDGHDEGGLDHAEALCLEMDETDSLTAFTTLNRRFHVALYGLRPGARLSRQIDQLYDAYDRYFAVEHSRVDRRERSQEEHRAILRACRGRNLIAARRALQRHISEPANKLVARLKGRLPNGQAKGS